MIFGAKRLAQRRAALLERASALRGELAFTAAPLVAKAAAADRLISALRTSIPWAARALTVYTLLKGRSTTR
jgi:hypothetical protein